MQSTETGVGTQPGKFVSTTRSIHTWAAAADCALMKCRREHHRSPALRTRGGGEGGSSGINA